jgi:hypothetical protein
MFDIKVIDIKILIHKNFKNMLMFVYFATFVVPLSLALNETCLKNNNKIINDFMDIILENGEQIITFAGFNKYRDLKLDCNRKYENENSSQIIFIPKIEILLNEDFKFEKMLTKIEDFQIYVKNMKGISFYEELISEINESTSFVNIFFFFGKLEAYLNETKIIPQMQCNQETFLNKTSSIQRFDILSFDQIVYPQEGVCAHVFQKCLARVILFDNIINSHLIKNRLSFLNKNKTFIPKLEYLGFELFYESLTSSLIDKYLFQNIRYLLLSRNLLGIESDLLNVFKSLRSIDFEILNLREFFHSSNKWLENLNNGSNIFLRSKINAKRTQKFMILRFSYLYEIATFYKPYTYGTEDICLFKKFPHSHLVVPILNSGNKMRCSCTIKWLQSYYYLYTEKLNLTWDFELFFEERSKPLGDVKFLFQYCGFHDDLECDFIKLFKSCSLIADKKSYHEFQDTEIFILMKWLEYIFLVILQPLFGFIGIINNSLVLVVVKNKDKKNILKDPMYLHIRLNSFFNIICSSIMILSILNTCISHNTFFTAFCSNVSTMRWTQYFKIIVHFYLGSVARTCMNVSFIFFSLSRFILVSNMKEKRFFKKFSNMSFSFYACMLIFLSFLLNLYKLFQYEINWSMSHFFDFPDDRFGEAFHCNIVRFTPICKLFESFKIVNNAFNDIILFLLSIGIDLFLLKYFHLNIDHKIRLRNIHADNSDLIKKKKKVNRMVLASGVVFFISHMPEFVVTIINLAFNRYISVCLYMRFSCELLSEISQFFGLISINFTFFLLLIFDNNFRESFICLKNKVKSKCWKKHCDKQRVDGPRSADVPVGERGLTRPLPCTDGQNEQAVLNEDLNGAVVLTELLNEPAFLTEGLYEALALTEALNEPGVLTEGLYEAVALTEVLNEPGVLTEGLYEALALTEALNEPGVLTEGLYEALALTEALNEPGVLTEGLYEAVVLTEVLNEPSVLTECINGLAI